MNDFLTFFFSVKCNFRFAGNGDHGKTGVKTPDLNLLVSSISNTIVTDF